MRQEGAAGSAATALSSPVFERIWNNDSDAVFDTITLGTYVTPDHLCPDLLRYEQIGAADGWRGRVVRGFFWLMRGWPVRGRQ